MNKKLALTLALALVLCITGCKNDVKATEFDESTLVIRKDGSVTEIMIDSFEQDYYSQSDLESYIDEQVKDYNRNNPSSSDEEGAVSIKKDKVVVEDKTARVELTYEGADDYEAFNLVELEVSTAADVTGDAMMLQFRDAEGNKVSYMDLDDLEKYQAVTVHTTTQVSVDGKIAYVSDNVTMIDDSTAKCEGTLSVIIYK